MAFNLADLAHPHGKYAHLVKDHGKKPPVRPPKMDSVPKVKAKKPFMPPPKLVDIEDEGAPSTVVNPVQAQKSKPFSFPRYRG